MSYIIVLLGICAIFCNAAAPEGGVAVASIAAPPPVKALALSDAQSQWVTDNSGQKDVTPTVVATSIINHIIGRYVEAINGMGIFITTTSPPEKKDMAQKFIAQSDSLAQKAVQMQALANEDRWVEFGATARIIMAALPDMQRSLKTEFHNALPLWFLIEEMTKKQIADATALEDRFSIPVNNVMINGLLAQL